MLSLTRNKNNLLMFLVVLFALFVGLYHLGDARISHDELKTLELIKENTSREVLTNFFSFNHVFFSFLLDVVHHLTDKFYLLRLVPVAFGVLAVAMTYRAGQPMVGDRAALVAAYFLTITPIFVQYLREMRGYSATVFFSLVVLFSLWRGIATGQKRFWVILVIASILGVYTHLYFTLALMTVALIIAGEWLLALRHRRRQQAILKLALVSFLAVGVSLAILYAPIISQALAVPQVQTLRTPIFGPFAPTWDFLHRFVTVFESFSPLGTFQNVDFFLVAVLLGCLSGLSQPTRRRATIWLLLWWLVPFVGNLLVMELAPGSSAQIRFHLHTLPAYLLLGSYGLFALAGYLIRLFRRVIPSDQTNSLQRIPWFGLMAILVLAVTIPATIESLNTRTDEAWTSVAAYLRSEVAPGDIILCEAFKLHDGRGGNDGSCSWQLSDVAKLISPSVPNQSLSQISNFRYAERRRDTLQEVGRVWFVIYFRGSLPYSQDELNSISNLTVKQFRSTWVVRVDSGKTLLENLIDTGHWLLKYVPDEKHLFDYNLDLAQLYALAGDLTVANSHLEQAFQIQKASSDPDWTPEFARLREVAALVGYYAPAAPSPQHIMNVNFDDRLKLLGYSLAPDSFSRSSEVKLSLYWQLVGSLEKDYSVLVHLRDGTGRTVGNFDFQPFDAILPTSQWPVGVEIREARRFSIPAELPPGEYTFVVGLYLPDTLNRLRVINDASGENVVSLGTVIVEGS